MTQPELTRMISNPVFRTPRNPVRSHSPPLQNQKRQERHQLEYQPQRTARSMKGILMLFEDGAAQQLFARDTEAFYNTKITKVEVTIEGVPNKLFSQGMRAYQMWDEAKFFAAGSKRHPEVAEVAKDLALADVSIGEFLTNKCTLWLDLRTIDDDRLHGSDRRVENVSEGVTIPITKQAEAADALNIYLYVIMDAQLNIENGRFVSAIH